MNTPERAIGLLASRRMFIGKAGFATAVVFLLVAGLMRSARAQLPGGTLDPTQLPKFVTPLFVPPAMPPSGQIVGAGGRRIDYYEIAARQFQQQVLPAGWPVTTVWGYGSLAQPGTVAQGGSFSYPGFSIEARWNTPVRIKWINDLRDPATGHYLPSLLPVDQTLHWANPPGPRDSLTMNPALYTGPVPLVPHLHGGHTGDESDGYPEAWFLPAATNIPSGFATKGTWYDYFQNEAAQKYGTAWQPGSAVFQYPNDQAATALWYHDHTLGVVRTNVYAGLAGFYLLRGGPGDRVGGRLPGPAPRPSLSGGTARPYEVPLLIQDRSFNADGSLFYPDSRLFFDGFAGPYIPHSDISPTWNAEFFGNAMVVNGHTWPYLEVERRRYRFRILNGCNARYLILKNDAGLPFWQIGADGGFLPRPARSDQLLIAPAERVDVIVDFSRARAGARIALLNVGPDEPFGGGVPGVDFESADPSTTGQVMQFRVVPATGPDTSTPPDSLELPQPPDLGRTRAIRQVSFNELDSDVLPGIGPRIGLLGTVSLSSTGQPQGVPLRWMDPITEIATVGRTEIWEIYDFTEDAHPFHVHQVEFELLNREVIDPESPYHGQILRPTAGERGRKDTVTVYPGMITRLRVHFDMPGRYVWHCHILEHEDNEMMRPLIVAPAR